jgi:hypothetical protein
MPKEKAIQHVINILEICIDVLRSLITYIYSGCNEVRIVRWKESFEESVHAKRPENTMVKRKRDKKLQKKHTDSLL